MEEEKPAGLFDERLRRRDPTDIGGVALTECLREAVEQQRISPGEADERLKAYIDAYDGRPPDQAA